jgi:threonine dehydratase
MGGGGLLSGIGHAIKALRPDAMVYAAEPATAAPLAASFKAGHATRFEGWSRSWVDGAGGQSVLASMWPVVSAVVAESIVVPLDDAAAAMRRVAEACHVIAEGAAACAIAAALSPRLRDRGHRRIVAIVSGGNIDLTRFAKVTGIGGPES